MMRYVLFLFEIFLLNEISKGWMTPIVPKIITYKNIDKDYVRRKRYYCTVRGK